MAQEISMCKDNPFLDDCLDYCLTNTFECGLKEKCLTTENISRSVCNLFCERNKDDCSPFLLQECKGDKLKDFMCVNSCSSGACDNNLKEWCVDEKAIENSICRNYCRRTKSCVPDCQGQNSLSGQCIDFCQTNSTLCIEEIKKYCSPERVKKGSEMCNQLSRERGDYKIVEPVYEEVCKDMSIPNFDNICKHYCDRNMDKCLKTAKNYCDIAANSNSQICKDIGKLKTLCANPANNKELCEKACVIFECGKQTAEKAPIKAKTEAATKITTEYCVGDKLTETDCVDYCSKNDCKGSLEAWCNGEKLFKPACINFCKDTVEKCDQDKIKWCQDNSDNASCKEFCVNDKCSKSSNKMWFIIGGVAGGVIFFIIIAVIIYFLKDDKKSNP